MNTTEQIVESYFRVCRDCLTIPDVKVRGGCGRQFDLLALCPRDGSQYHVEIQVSHSRQWCLGEAELFERFEAKFLGALKKKTEPRRKNHDPTKKPRRKSFLAEIYETYRWYRFHPDQIRRVWVCWDFPADPAFNAKIQTFSTKHRLRHVLEILSFRKDIVPNLLSHVGTAHYEDTSLRTLSLMQQCKIQGNIEDESTRQGEIAE